MYSNPPVHGARIVANVVGDPTMFDEWRAEMQAMAGRIKTVRQRLYDELSTKDKSSKDWSFVLKQIGMFSFTGLNKAQVVLSSLLLCKLCIIRVFGTAEFPSRHHFDLGLNEDIGLGRRNSPVLITHYVVVLLDGLEQSDNMTDKWHVYMTKDGRISLAGLNLAKCAFLADAIIDSFYNVQ
jgi:aspartate/tyrosine/aromatic aminotransferase